MTRTAKAAVSLVVVSAGISSPSSTRLLADRLSTSVSARLAEEHIVADITVVELSDLPVLIAATGGTERHSLALDYGIRPLFIYHRAIVSTTGVYAATADWGSSAAGGAGGGGLADRIGRAAIEFAGLMIRSERDTRPTDPFALPLGFDPAGTLTSS